MSNLRCVLCDQPAGDDYRVFSLSPEAQDLYERRFRGADPSSLLAKNVMCARCLALPKSARSALAREAITRELESYARDDRRERFLRRIDIGRTIDSVPLTNETWEWLNLVGYAITLTQAQARAQEANAEWFQSVDAYKVILTAMIAKDINTMGAIFMALRCEWTHQAATLARTLCESLITLRYIAQDKTTRSRQFLDYAVIEQYKAAESLLKWGADHAKPEYVAQMKAFKATISAEYEAMRPAFTFTDRNGKERPFSNWCNEKLADMGKKTDSERLYRLVYNQTSPYVHGSAWSLRAVGALTARGYDARRALIDTSTLIRATLAVWFQWAVFCNQELGWTFGADLDELKERLDQLQVALDARMRT
jgi:Family of unknown function (DUF5677)